MLRPLSADLVELAQQLAPVHLHTPIFPGRAPRNGPNDEIHQPASTDGPVSESVEGTCRGRVSGPGHFRIRWLVCGRRVADAECPRLWVRSPSGAKATTIV
ncbi:hypothetical protein [Streptomyces sanglieri]|uniref:hypothetical protein n=1 Tax=Streptomyces sanglieri TaxID=193460 RepID=UPI002F91AD95